MPVLTCPQCGNSGEIRLSEEAFEPRGQWPEGHYPVRKCKQCGAGIIVRPRFFIFGTRPVLIPDDTWRRMEAMFDRAMADAGWSERQRCEQCGRDFDSVEALANHSRDMHAHVCDRCGKGLRSESALANHLREAHRNAPPTAD